MQKLYTANGNLVQFIGGFAVIGGKQYRLANPENPEIKRLTESRKIISLEGYEFPDEANQVEYHRYLRANNGSNNVAAEKYLADLLEKKSNAPADVDVETANKPTGRKKKPLDEASTQIEG